MSIYELLLNSEGAFFLLVTLVCFAFVVAATVAGLRDRTFRGASRGNTVVFGGRIVSLPSAF